MRSWNVAATCRGAAAAALAATSSCLLGVVARFAAGACRTLAAAGAGLAAGVLLGSADRPAVTTATPANATTPARAPARMTRRRSRRVDLTPGAGDVFSAGGADFGGAVGAGTFRVDAATGGDAGFGGGRAAGAGWGGAPTTTGCDSNVRRTKVVAYHGFPVDSGSQPSATSRSTSES